MTIAVSRRHGSNRVWAAFAMPGVGWLLVFFVVSVYAVMAVAFGGVDPFLKTSIPAWNPLEWDVTSMGNVIHEVFNGYLRKVFLRTFAFVGLALAGCIAIGYPVAYYAARKAGRHKGLLLAALVLPFWISYLMRMLAWTNLLQPDGLVNQVLGWFSLPDNRNWLDGDWYTVVIGLTYGYVPFFILPLYSTLERLDGRLIEAGRDLGASARQTFLRVTLPLSVPGLMAASVITVLPMFGDYYTNSYLTSGSPRTEMVGNQIENYLRNTSQPQTGASLVLILMAMLFVLMVYYMVTTIRQQRAAER
ncbi:MAG TPA: ABC transporter permease [Ilumatobacteraceae bacterium]|nr:ABC transporter permease [Ilumatobacteraceae bacterium]HRB02664.1 ABC transporter permease [Ilumatobacteraceae bacterium]